VTDEGGEEGDNQGVNNAVAAAVRRRVPGLVSLTMNVRHDVQRYVVAKAAVVMHFGGGSITNN